MNDPELRRLLKSLTGEVRILSQRIQSANDEANSEKEGEAKQPVGPLKAEVKTDSITQQAIREYYTAENRERNSWWGRNKGWIETLGVIAALVLAVLTFFTFREIQKQTASIKNSADAAKAASSAASSQVTLMQRQMDRQDARVIVELQQILSCCYPPRPAKGFSWPGELLIKAINQGMTGASIFRADVTITLKKTDRSQTTIRDIGRPSVSFDYIDEITPPFPGFQPNNSRDTRYDLKLRQNEIALITTGMASITSEATFEYKVESGVLKKGSTCSVYWSSFYTKPDGVESIEGGVDITCEQYKDVLPNIPEKIRKQRQAK